MERAQKLQLGNSSWRKQHPKSEGVKNSQRPEMKMSSEIKSGLARLKSKLVPGPGRAQCPRLEDGAGPMKPWEATE